MLLAQALNVNATMGNASGIYVGGFWAGLQSPLGLAMCLLVCGLFYAEPLNREYCGCDDAGPNRLYAYADLAE